MLENRPFYLVYFVFPFQITWWYPREPFLSNVVFCTYIHVDMDAYFMKRQNANSPENITWCEIGKQKKKKQANPQGPEEMCLSLEHQNPSKTSKKRVILIAIRFRYTFYRPQTKRLRARKVGLQYKIRNQLIRSITTKSHYSSTGSRGVSCE